MRRIGPAAALALLAVTGCSDGTPDQRATSAPPTTTLASPSSTPSAVATPQSWPAGCTSPAPAPAGATVVTAGVTGGRVTTAQRRYDVPLRGHVRLVVTTDAADEVHVHSYDVKAATTPGCPAVLDFQATIPGTVEVELEKGHTALFTVRAR